MIAPVNNRGIVSPRLLEEFFQVISRKQQWQSLFLKWYNVISGESLHVNECLSKESVDLWLPLIGREHLQILPRWFSRQLHAAARMFYSGVKVFLYVAASETVCYDSHVNRWTCWNTAAYLHKTSCMRSHLILNQSETLVVSYDVFIHLLNLNDWWLLGNN